MSDIDGALRDEAYCYVTTVGRVTAKPHTVEIWFALMERTVYILAGGRHRSDWVTNAKKQPRVTVRIAARTFDGTARIVEAGPEDMLARRLLVEKYARDEDDLDDWGMTALPVAIDLDGP